MLIRLDVDTLANLIWETLDLGGVDTLGCGYLGELKLGGIGSGRH